MVASVVADTITKITERLSSLHVFGDKAIAITHDIKQHLLTIVDAATPAPEWINDVMDAITDLWDLLDNQHLPADAARLPKQSKITSFFSLCNGTPHRRNLLFQLERIKKLLQQIAADSTELSPMNRRELTSSDVEDREIKIVGRASDKEKVVSQVLALTKVKSSDVEDREIKIVGRESEKEILVSQVLALTKVEGAVQVFTILGMQGMGKTTLAKLVYSDDRVEHNFDLLIWIDGIHDEFYAKSIVQRMIHESAMKKKEKPEEKDEDINLKEAMSGSRFLLLLDDFQSENREEWLRLLQMLTEAASSSGAAVLVTTQDSLVARQVIQSGILQLEGLNEENSWTLYEQIAGRGGDPSESKIRDAQKKMVNKCRGVPLAIIIMARLLTSREAITESDIENLEKEFMQKIKQIYYDELPSWHLKQCFAYLSFIFSSKEYRFMGEAIIRRFVAEGFLGPMNSNPEQLQPEYWGLDCIQEFRRRSILNVYDFLGFGGSMSTCSMYSELMLELSRFVAGKDRFCFCTDDHDEIVKETVRRVALTRDFDVSNGIPKSLNKNNKNLHTILFFKPYNYGWSSRIPYEVKLRWSACDALFCAFKNLRVLNLTDLGMNVLPISIGELKSLRYLDLSHNNMKKLPKSIGKLKRLQTLILSHCHQLRELPREVEHLVSLRHLLMQGCLHLTHMPSALEKLTNLQTLSNFVAGNNHKHMRGIGELINLNNLRGELKISHLERLKFKESEQDGHAYLKEKQHLMCLDLQWDHDDEDADGDNNHDQISLALLEPHSNLKGLCIKGYRGASFSQWLSSLKDLVQLILYNCSKCKCLPPLEQFPKLKTLYLQRLDSLEYITDQDDGSNKLVLKLLKILVISDCPKLTSWWKGTTHSNARFGSILSVRIKYCPKLDCTPLFPNIYGRLALEGSSVKPLLETINYTSASNSRIQSDLDSILDSSPPLSKVINLRIKNVEERSALPEDWLKNFVALHRLWISENMSLMKGFKHLSSLKTMVITNCTGVDLPGDEWEGLQSLLKLVIEEVIDLKSLPEGITYLTSLEFLRIEGCAELTTLTEGLGHLTSLKSLKIVECHKLASLPKGTSNLKSLNELIIRNCPLLLPRCQKETGDDWPQIKHIKDIRLAGTSEIYE